MKFGKFLFVAAFACGLPVVQASASPVLYCKDGPGIDLTGGCISGEAPGYPGGGDGIYSNAGGGDPEAKVEQAILQATGVAVDISLYGKSDSNPGLFSFTPDSGADLASSNSGSWTVLDGTLISYITIKAANSFALYLVNPASSTGLYTTLGLLNAGDQQPNVSHISFWTTKSDTSVPEPTSAALLMLGAGTALRRKLRK